MRVFFINAILIMLKGIVVYVQKLGIQILVSPQITNVFKLSTTQLPSLWTGNNNVAYPIGLLKELRVSSCKTLTSDPEIFKHSQDVRYMDIKLTCVRHVWEFPVAFFHNITVIWRCIKNAAPKALNCTPARCHSLKYFPCLPVFKTPWAAGKKS